MISLYDEWKEEERGRKARQTTEQRNNIDVSLSSSSSTNNFYYDGVPKPVVFKVINHGDKKISTDNNNANIDNSNQSGNRGYSLMKVFDYLSRDQNELLNEEELEKELSNEEDLREQNFKNNTQEKLELETDDGRILDTKQKRYDYYKEWSDTFTKRKDGKDYEHVLLSTLEKPGQSNQQVLDSARETLYKKFGKEGYNYTFVLHTDTDYLHVHAVIRVHNPTNNKRLDIRKDDIWNTKVAFAKELKSNGLNYEASINYERIRGLSNKLEYIKATDLTWFRSNVEKIKNVDVKEILNQMKSIDDKLDYLSLQREQTKDTLTKKSINKRISELYTEKRTHIYSLNELEKDLKRATQNYKDVFEKREKVSWHLKGTKAYKELDQRTNEAYELVKDKKNDIDLAQNYLSQNKTDLTFSQRIKKDTLSYIGENIDNEKNIDKILNRIEYLESKLPKAQFIKEIKEYKKLLKDDKYLEYRELAKGDIFRDLQDASFNKRIIDKLQKNRDIYDYELKKLGLDIEKYSFTTYKKTTNALLLDDTTKEDLLKKIDYSKHSQSDRFYKYIYSQIERENIIYEHQLKSLNINIPELLKDNEKSLTPIEADQQVLDLVKTYVDNNNKNLDNQKPKPKPKPIKAQTINSQKQRLTDDQVKELMRATKEELLMTDPAPILMSLGLEPRFERGGTQYKFRARQEDKTKSAFMYLDGSTWKFNDFGGSSGTIENVVMETTGMNYKEALNFCLDELGIVNQLEEKLNNIKYESPTLNQEHIDRLEALKNANIEKVETNQSYNSKIVSIREIDLERDKEVVDFLANRGITEIPKDFFVIEGETNGISKKTGREYSFTNKGVGVITGDMSKDIDINTQGADIHLLNPITTSDGSKLKTVSYGVKDITLVPKENSKEYAIFESKMDYAAALTQDKSLNDKNCIIANGVGNHRSISKLLNENEVDSLKFYNQFDKAGNNFVKDVLSNTEKIKEFQYIQYNKEEQKKDINDLHEDKIDLKERTRKGSLNQFLISHGEKPIEKVKEYKEINYEEVVKEHIEKVKGFSKEVVTVLDKEAEVKNIKDYEQQLFSSSKTLASELKRNLNQIESAKNFLEVTPNADKEEKSLLQDNINSYLEKAQKLNGKITEYFKSIDSSKLTDSKRNTLKVDFYSQLNKSSYNERIMLHTKDKEQIIKRQIDNIRVVSNELSKTNLDKQRRESIINESKNLSKEFNNLSPSFGFKRQFQKHFKSLQRTNQRTL